MEYLLRQTPKHLDSFFRPLFYAISENDFDTVKFHINDPILKRKDYLPNFNLAHIAIMRAEDIEIIRLIIDKVCLVDLEDCGKNGSTSLQLAVNEDRLDVVKMLVEDYCVKVDNPGGKDRTPLMISAFLTNKEITQYLINHGANVNWQDSYGRTALHFIAKDIYPDVTDLLLKNGADIEIRSTHDNASPLDVAVNNAAIDNVILLLAEANRLNLDHSYYHSAIDYVVDKRAVETRQIVISHIENLSLNKEIKAEQQESLFCF
jgi:ankyrin repeat protein